MENPAHSNNEAQRLEALNSTHLLENNESDIFDNLTEIIRQVFDTPVVALSFVERENLYFKSIQGRESIERSRDVSFCGYVVDTRTALIISDTLKDARFFDSALVKSSSSIRFYAGIPINYDYNDQTYTIGTICIVDFRPRKFSSKKLVLLKRFALQIERSIEFFVATQQNVHPEEHKLESSVQDLITQRDKYRKMSELDALTELHNRRFLYTFLDKEWYLDKHHEELSIMLIDLDGFKQINDVQGHHKGDEILKSVAKSMRHNLRRGQDTIIRIGGDEFVVVLFDTSPENSLAVGKKLLNSLGTIHVSERLGYLSASIGITSTTDKTIALQNILTTADALMYKAKNNGKSRIEYDSVTHS